MPVYPGALSGTLFIEGRGWRRAKLCGLDVQGSATRTASLCARQTRVDSPLPWGEGVGQALLPVSKAGAWRASSQAGVPAPLRQPERDG
jgi:hypothetical protein